MCGQISSRQDNDNQSGFQPGRPTIPVVNFATWNSGRVARNISRKRRQVKGDVRLVKQPIRNIENQIRDHRVFAKVIRMELCSFLCTSLGKESTDKTVQNEPEQITHA